MKVWYCESHDCGSGELSPPDELATSVCWAWHHEKLIPCRMVEMQLVPADARTETQCPNCKFVYELEKVP